MAGPHPAVAALRAAVRPGLAATTGPVLVACSGGADSVALAAALAFEAPRSGRRVGAVTVDHGLQPGSAEQARRTADLLRSLRLDPVYVVPVVVGGNGGPEGAARDARTAALREVAAGSGGTVALGHTLDDQAETVLLGLARGSGPRSVAGMVEHRPPFWAAPPGGGGGRSPARRSGGRCWACAGRRPGSPARRRSCRCGTTRGTPTPPIPGS